MSVFSMAVDSVFLSFGSAAIYTPSGGGGGERIGVTILVRRPDEIVEFGDTRIQAETSLFEIRASEISHPRPGDRFSVAGEDYVIQGEPVRDPERLTWKVEAVTA